MDMRPECVPCLLKRVLFQARLAANGTEFKAVSAATNVLAKEFQEHRNSAAVATKVHRSAYDAMGSNDPYLDMKIKADEVAADYIESAREYVNTAEDKLKAAILISCIGNIMDFGSGIAIDRPEDFHNEFHRLLEQGIGSDDTDAVRSILERSEKVLYLFDNCGETQLDTILLDVLREMGLRVTGIVRGEPILNDVTENDAHRIGLMDHLDKMTSTGQFAIGIDLQKIGEDLKDEIRSADLMIAKGMANYESLSDQHLDIPIVFILRSKCRPVADSLGVETDINVVRLLKD